MGLAETMDFSHLSFSLPPMDFSGIKVDTDALKAAAAAEKAAADAEKAKADKAEADKQAEANRFLTSSQESPEQAAFRQQMLAQSQGQGLQTAALTARLQQQAQKQAMAMAYARGGYNPGAVRGAQMASAEAQGNIAGQGAQMQAQEQAQTQAMYSQLLQARQQQQFAGEQARAAYLAGDKALAQQWQISQMQNATQIKGIEETAQANAAQLQQTKDASNLDFWTKLGTAVIGAGSTTSTALIRRNRSWLD